MGKLKSEALKGLLACIKTDKRLVAPPASGFDSGVHLIDGKYLVVSTDPCIGVPEEWFGYLLIHYAASDVALFGAKPEFCTINILGPESTPSERFQEIMTLACKTANELNIAIVTGHTGTYKSISTMVGATTAYGRVRKQDLKTPASAEANDIVLCVKSIGLEIVVNYSLQKRTEAQNLFGKIRTRQLQKLVPLQSCVNEALSLSQIRGIHAMHDATEGGLTAALNEFSDASKLGFTVYFDKIPFLKEALILKQKFHLSDTQLLSLSSTGTFLVAVSPNMVEKAEKAMRLLGIETSRIGAFSKKYGRILVKAGKANQFPTEAYDPYDKIMDAEPQKKLRFGSGLFCKT